MVKECMKDELALSKEQIKHLDLFFKRKKLSVITDPDFTPEQKQAWNELHDQMQRGILDHFLDNKL